MIGAAFAEVLTSASSGELPAALRSCARYLERHRLLHRSPQILEVLDAALLARQSYRRAVVAAADELPPSAVDEIERVLSHAVADRVRARVRVQPDLLAGFRAEIGDLYVDASLRGVLSRLRATFRQHTTYLPTTRTGHG